MFVDSGVLTFANHGCNRTYNVGEKTSVDEFTADLDSLPEEVNGESHTGTTIFNPLVDRHVRREWEQSLRDIAAGEEILDNYLAFTGNNDDWAKDVQDLRNQCSGQATGLVSDYEKRHQ